MKTAIVAHPKRRAMVARLAEQIDAGRVVFDTESALSGHRKALEWAATQKERVVIFEDDALPVEGWRFLMEGWLQRFPEDAVSFYLGTGYPIPWQGLIDDHMQDADERGEDHIRLRTLIHGVCYSLPPESVSGVLAGLSDALPADFAIGSAYRRTGRGAFVYPCASVVDHFDGQSYAYHPDQQERVLPRKARRLAHYNG